MRIAHQRHPLSTRGQSTCLLHRQKGFAAAGSAAHLAAMQRPGRVQDDGLAFGEDVGGVIDFQGPRHDVALRQAPATQHGAQLLDAGVGEQRMVELLADQIVAQPVGQLRQVGAVDHLPAREVRQIEVGGEFGVRQCDDVIPAQPALRPARAGCDEFAQRVAGVAGLAHRLDVDVVAAAVLSLPSVEIVDRVLGRGRGVLEQIAVEIGWPTQYERVVAAARGVYRGQAPGVPTWSGYRQTSRLNISHPQWRIQVKVEGGSHVAGRRRVHAHPPPILCTSDWAERTPGRLGSARSLVSISDPNANPTVW